MPRRFVPGFSGPRQLSSSPAVLPHVSSPACVVYILFGPLLHSSLSTLVRVPTPKSHVFVSIRIFAIKFAMPYNVPIPIPTLWL